MHNSVDKSVLWIHAHGNFIFLGIKELQLYGKKCSVIFFHPLAYITLRFLMSSSSSYFSQSFHIWDLINDNFVSFFILFAVLFYFIYVRNGFMNVNSRHFTYNCLVDTRISFAVVVLYCEGLTSTHNSLSCFHMRDGTTHYSNERNENEEFMMISKWCTSIPRCAPWLFERKLYYWKKLNIQIFIKPTQLYFTILVVLLANFLVFHTTNQLYDHRLKL
jgi:hypothetical protein